MSLKYGQVYRGYDLPATFLVLPFRCRQHRQHVLDFLHILLAWATSNRVSVSECSCHEERWSLNGDIGRGNSCVGRYSCLMTDLTVGIGSHGGDFVLWDSLLIQLRRYRHVSKYRCLFCVPTQHVNHDLKLNQNRSTTKPTWSRLNPTRSSFVSRSMVRSWCSLRVWVWVYTFSYLVFISYSS